MINNEKNSKLMKSKSVINLYNNNLKCFTNIDNNFNNLNCKSPPLTVNRYKENSINSSTNNNKHIFSSLSSPKPIKNNINNAYSKKEEINPLNKLMILRKNFFLKNINSNIKDKSKNNLNVIKALKKYRRFNALNNIKYMKSKDNNIKSYFKGVESVFIYPEQIYPVLKDNKSKDHNTSFKSENKYEFKEDQNCLINEDKAKLNLIHSKDFYNYLINREIFFKTQINKNNIFIEKNTSEEKNHLNEKLKYLKEIAFNNKNSLKKNNSIGYKNENNDDTNKDNIDTNTSGNELSNAIKKKNEEDNTEKVRIDGEIYILKNQMEQIAKKILTKCKYYNDLK
jgi:hypothetical protein